MQPVSGTDATVDAGHAGGQALRGWQRRALVNYLAAQPRDFLAVATPGSGKTTFALRVAAELLGQRAVERITVVVPTEHLKVQWARAAERHGLALDPRFSNTSPQTSPEYRCGGPPIAAATREQLKERIIAVRQLNSERL